MRASCSVARVATSALRLPSLDGLRAISIGLVLLGHTIPTADYLARLVPLEVLASFGVRVFFVISGYLISTLLFHEIGVSGRLSLGKFYFRRAFRIFPAFYVLVAVVAGLASAGLVSLEPGDLLHAVTYTTNYHHERARTLGHLWSLAVEEQFYLLWPAILLLLGRRRGLCVAVGFVLVAPIVRVATLKLHLGPEAGIGESFQTIGDAIAVGCVLAGYGGILDGSPRYAAFQRSPAFVVVPLVAIAFVFFSHRPAIDFTIGQTATNIGVALTVHWCIRHPDGIVGRSLNSRPLVYIGTLSYSLYLWQQTFLHRAEGASYARFPLNVGLTFVAALASYYFVEKPFLRLRERIEPRLFGARTVGRRDRLLPTRFVRCGAKKSVRRVVVHALVPVGVNDEGRSEERQVDHLRQGHRAGDAPGRDGAARPERPGQRLGIHEPGGRSDCHQRARLRRDPGFAEHGGDLARVSDGNDLLTPMVASRLSMPWASGLGGIGWV